MTNGSTNHRCPGETICPECSADGDYMERAEREFGLTGKDGE